MIRWLKRLAVGFAAFIAVMVALGWLISVLDPEGTKRRQQESEAYAAKKEEAAKAAKAQEEKSATSSEFIYKHGFAIGYQMAKNGDVKPGSDQVDAFARKAAKALNDGGGMGFKMVWKDGFWAGWSKGD
jgi:hypothetical protein